MRRDLRQDLPALTRASSPEPPLGLSGARRRLAVDAAGILVSIVGFGVVYGLSARNAGLSLPEAIAMSTLTFAGASQFAALGLIAQGAPWPAIVLLTALLNARHLLYSAALYPWLRDVPRRSRAVMAHFLTDEAFALSLHHFQRLGRTDIPGYWMAALLVFVPWNLSVAAGVIGGSAVADPTRLGLDVIFPAAMGGLAILLIKGRRDLAAAVIAILVAVALGLAIHPAVGIVVGGLVGPLVVVLVRPERPTPGAEAPAGIEAVHDASIGPVR
ncbi:MAG TPA: AzlC family ABC transporter permease [Candidatus Limnocylindrales bacterium]